jgi:hypothetical protein
MPKQIPKNKKKSIHLQTTMSPKDEERLKRRLKELDPSRELDTSAYIRRLIFEDMKDTK